jgi:hypothetical protein
MTRFLADLGDRINPIVVKETRQAVNSRMVAAFLLLFLAIQLVVMFLMISSRELRDPDEIDLRAGRDLFRFVQGILLGTCLILIPTMTGARLAAERSDVNVDLLFISSLSPRAVLSGKLVAAAALALLIFSACAPFMTFAYVMRGLEVSTILIVLTADYLAVLLTTMFSLFLASVPANRGMRIALGVGGFACVCYLGAGLLRASSNFLQGNTEFDTGSWQFWIGFTLLAGLIFGLIGLLFVWSVALISPPAANRAYAVRIYTLAFWIATGLGFGLWGLYVERPRVMLVWGLIGCVLFSLQFIIGVCERDEWGPRVARVIPRRFIFRMPAFFFYSGAAGGIAFGVIGAALSVVGLAVWFHYLPPTGPFGEEDKPALLVALIAAYTYCFCLSAAVFRRLLVGSVVRPGHTWIIAALLFGLGTILPYVVLFLFFERSSARYAYREEPLGLHLTNPIVMIDDVFDRSTSALEITIVFLLVWGGLVTVVNLPWFVQQMTHFRPPERRAGADQ